MELSMFLAKLLGFYFIIIAADMILGRRQLEGAVKDVASSKGLLVLSGSGSLLFGLAIVIAHPIYAMNWQGLITLLGWIMIIRGINRFAFPSHVQKQMVSIFHKRYRALFAILLILGIFLLYSGFTANPELCA